MDQDNAIKYLRELKSGDQTFQALCKMCGKCCKFAITGYSHSELLRRAAENDIEAISFLRVFKKYDSSKAAKEAFPEFFQKIIHEFSLKEDYNIDDFPIYYCEYNIKNKCSIYNDRPECCRRAPSSGWVMMPPDCGFEGWQFEQREYQKRVVRNLKELLYELNFYDDEKQILVQGKTVNELKVDIEKKIEPWKKYGADNW